MCDAGRVGVVVGRLMQLGLAGPNFWPSAITLGLPLNGPH